MTNVGAVAQRPDVSHDLLAFANAVLGRPPKPVLAPMSPNDLPELRVGSVFTGIGGFELGIRRAGVHTRTQWMCEKDENCLRLLGDRFPGVRLHEDIETLSSPEPVDLLVGGFPCQDSSQMQDRHGKRVGLDGARTGLFWKTLDLIDALRPAWLILENVKGFIDVEPGLWTALQALSDLGYMGEWRLIDGAAFNLPLRRDHVFIVGANRRDYGDLDPGTWLEDPSSGHASGRELREGVGQYRPTDGRPRRGRDYRLLTPEECEAGVGFPVGWTGDFPQTVRYHMLGNSVAVPSVAWVVWRTMLAKGRRARNLWACLETTQKAA